jgi:hypothetical protein
MVLLSLGRNFVLICLVVTGGWGNGQMGLLGGMVLVGRVLVPDTFWVADVFSRGDERCARFARWVSEKCFTKG